MRVPVWRELNAERMNALLNAPDIRETVDAPSDQPLDVTTIVANRQNYLVMGEHGGIVFIRLMPGVYECHTAVDKSARGAWASGLIVAAVHWLFTRTDAYEIVTRVPSGHIAAFAASRLAGLRLEMTLPGACNFRGKIVDLHVLSYRIQDWLTRAPDLVERGRWLHMRLQEEARKLGIDAPAHANDDIHNRYAGCAVEMAFGGNLAKGVSTYNRWALLTRHPTVSVVGDRLVRFDIGLLEFHEADIEVIPDVV